MKKYSFLLLALVLSLMQSVRADAFGNDQRVVNLMDATDGNNGESTGTLISEFCVSVRAKGAQTETGITFSTNDEQHWYYIYSTSTQDYAKGKVWYYDASTDRMMFGDKAFMADRIWSFWKNAQGKIAIKNYEGVYVGTAGAGTGGSTQFGKASSANYIYQIDNIANGQFAISDGGTPLHAQQAGSVLVRWAAEANNASTWNFQKVNTEYAAADIAATKVEQGKVTTGIGNKDVAILRSTVTVSGLTGAIDMQGIKGRIVATDVKDVKAVRAYFATNAQELFVDADKQMTWRKPNAELFAEGTLAADGTYTIKGSKALKPGTHYLWVALDIADDAKEGNTVDATITAYTVNGEEKAEKAGNPAHAATIFLSEGSVLMPMDKGSLYYRIPAIATSADGKRLVTLTDDRKNHNADLPSHCYVVAQYSEDNGRTWSDPVTVAGTADRGGDYGHGDASLITNRINGDIIGIMTTSANGAGYFASTPEKPQTWKTIVSHDGGLTWEAPVDHTKELYAKGSPHPNWLGGFTGSGAGLQKRDGTLVSPFVNRESPDGTNNNVTQNYYNFMSKDGGNTWYVSGTSGTLAADEPKVLERNNGDLAISVRASGYNYHNVTSDDGQTWKLPSQTRFTSGFNGNACDGEYMYWCSTLDGNLWNIVLQTMPNSGSRENVSIALSTDEGDTFSAPKTICPRGSAYSAATVLPDGTVGVYYEENGLFGGYTMRFVRFSLDWASSGKYKFTTDAPFRPIQSRMERTKERK
ncbi:MAG: exo-alpha-sialidase [Bacteroidales bacterium]|nr:exo-alpha-sialidase [Bacteroidales bacterium]